ncbi:MAG: hypothetical protein AMXMBFR53_43130 [Gemmatimonadota bacterium]
MTTTGTDQGRSASGEVTIHATPERVWQALTDAAELERWFPLEARVEPGEGGTMMMSWKNEFVGNLKILAWEPPRHLRTAWAFHEHDHAAPQVTDYHVTAEAGGVTRVRVVTSGFPDDPAWDGWVEGTNRGWRYELRALKHYLENFPGQDRDVVYLRRRVDISAAEAWGRLFPATGPALSHVAGRVFDEDPPMQWAAVAEDPRDAMLRVSLEPTGAGTDLRDVTVFMSTWGDDAARAGSLADTWRRELARLFPEGTDA